MRPSHLFRIYVLEILLLSLVWNGPPQPSLGASATSQEAPINQLLSEAAKLTGATNREVVSDWLRALVEVGREGEAFVWARQIADPNIQSQALRTMAETLFRAGARDEALRAAEAAHAAARRIERIKDTNDIIEGRSRGRSDELRKLAEILGQHGEVEYARQLAAEAFTAALEIGDADEDTRFSNLRQAVLQLTRLGQPDEAIAALRRIEEPSFRAHATYSALGELVAAGAFEQAMQAFRAVADDQARTDGRTEAREPFADPPGSGDISQSLAPADYVSEAIRFASRAPEPQSRVAALLNAARGAIKAGHSAVAEKLLAAAIDSVRQIDATESFMLRQLYLRSVIEALLENNQVDESLQLARAEALESYRQDCLRFVADYFVKSSRADRIDRWLNVLDEIEDERSRSAALLSGLEAMIQTGRLDGWLAMANAIEDPYARANLLCSTVEQLVKLNLRTEARQTAETALGVLRQINPDFATSKRCADFAIKLAAWREPDLAIEAAHLCADADNKLAAFTALLRMYYQP